MTAHELYERRTQLQLSRVGLAKILKVSPQTIYQWEKERRQIPAIVETVFRLLAYAPSSVVSRHRSKKAGGQYRSIK